MAPSGPHHPAKRGSENFFRHFQRFLSRFPGWEDEDRAERILAAYLLSQEEKQRFGRSPAYQFQLNFNRAD